MKDKVVIITGAGSGFGAETSVLFASLGCKLTLVDRTTMQETYDRCLQAGLKKDHILLIVSDITDMNKLKEIPQKTVQCFGKLDVLVNSAGIAGYQNVATTTEDEYNKVMGVNAKAMFFLIQHCVPHLLKTKGNVVNVSSATGMRPRAKCTTYAISKAAVNQITQCAALELGPQQIRVNAVNPGHCRTGLYAAAGIAPEEIEPYLERMKALYPLGRIGSALEIAKAILFLADENQSSFITGVCLPVDGGYCLGNNRN